MKESRQVEGTSSIIHRSGYLKQGLVDRLFLLLKSKLYMSVVYGTRDGEVSSEDEILAYLSPPQREFQIPSRSF